MQFVKCKTFVAFTQANKYIYGNTVLSLVRNFVKGANSRMKLVFVKFGFLLDPIERSPTDLSNIPPLNIGEFAIVKYKTNKRDRF